MDVALQIGPVLSALVAHAHAPDSVSTWTRGRALTRARSDAVTARANPA